MSAVERRLQEAASEAVLLGNEGVFAVLSVLAGLSESALRLFELRFPCDLRPRRAFEALRGFLRKEAAAESDAFIDAGWNARAAALYLANHHADLLSPKQAAYAVYFSHSAAAADTRARIVDAFVFSCHHAHFAFRSFEVEASAHERLEFLLSGRAAPTREVHLALLEGSISNLRRGRGMSDGAAP